MRKEKRITLDDRGQSLTFKVKEMSATRLESWTLRAALLLTGGGGKALSFLKGISADDMADMRDGRNTDTAIRALLMGGFDALSAISYESAKPLLDELLGCCSRVVGNIEEQCTPETVDDYVQDFFTLIKLRKEAFMLNFDFFIEKARQPAEPSSLDPSPQTLKISKNKQD